MKKLVKVHELPTKDKSHIGLYIDVRGKLNIYYRNELTPQIKTFFPQHVYFTSDEIPKDGDWFIRNVGSILAVEQYIKDDHLYANDRKIVATTDKALCNLKQNGHLGQAIIPIPQISQQDQEAYVKAGGIDEVLLEYETTRQLYYPFQDFKSIKTDQNNCVITSLVEPKLYSGIDLMGNQDGSFDHFLLHSSKFSQEEREVIMDAVHDWIKENL